MLKIEAIGNLGFDSEIKQIGGRNALSFSIAHSERDRDGHETTQWIECLYFSNNPEKLQPHLTKGKSVHVRGNMRASTWVDRQGGTRISITCFVGEFDFCGGKANDNNQSAGTTAPTPAQPAYNPAPAPAYNPEPARPVAPPPTTADMFMTTDDPKDDLPF